MCPKILSSRYTGHAMPALALKDNKNNMWEPVGEENLFALVKEESGYMIAFVNKWDCKNRSLSGLLKKRKIQLLLG